MWLSCEDIGTLKYFFLIHLWYYQIIQMPRDTDLFFLNLRVDNRNATKSDEEPVLRISLLPKYTRRFCIEAVSTVRKVSMHAPGRIPSDAWWTFKKNLQSCYVNQLALCHLQLLKAWSFSHPSTKWRHWFSENCWTGKKIPRFSHKPYRAYFCLDRMYIRPISFTVVATNRKFFLFRLGLSDTDTIFPDWRASSKAVSDTVGVRSFSLWKNGKFGCSTCRKKAIFNMLTALPCWRPQILF